MGNNAPWVKQKTEEGRQLCLLALRNDLEYIDINFDELYREFIKSGEDDQVIFLKSKLNPVDNKPAAADQPKKSRSINGYSKTGAKLGRPLKDEKPRKEVVQELKKDKNADSFLLVPNSPPDVVNNTDLYIENLKSTVIQVKSEFFAEYPDLIKKHPSIWFRHLCNTIKKNCPKFDFDNIQLMSAVWDIYSDLCISIGINRTIENFEIFTGFSYDFGEKIRKESSPEAVLLTKKIYKQCRSDLVGGLSTSFGSSPNQMFIAKAVYGLTENTVITHVSAAAETKNIDDIPLFLPEK